MLDLNKQQYTKQVSHILPLKLIKLSPDFITNNQDKLVTFLEKHINSKSTTVSLHLAVNRYAQLLITNTVFEMPDDAYGVKQFEHKLPTNICLQNENYRKLAKTILSQYLRWFKMQTFIQSKLSTKQLIQYTEYYRLFTPQAYIDWLVPRLNTLKPSEYNQVSYAFPWINYDYDYFATKLILASDLEAILSKTSLTSLIVRSALYDNKFHRTTNITYLFMQIQEKYPYDPHHITIFTDILKKYFA